MLGKKWNILTKTVGATGYRLREKNNEVRYLLYSEDKNIFRWIKYINVKNESITLGKHSYDPGLRKPCKIKQEVMKS